MARPAGGPQGGPDLPLPPALRALRRGPGPAAGQRLPLRRLRPAQAGAGRHRPQDGGERHLLGRGQQLLRPPPQPLPHHRPGRPVHRPASLQRGPVRPGGRAPAGDRSASPTPSRRARHPRPQPRQGPVWRAPLRQLPRHVGAAARLDLRAPARARAGPRRRRHRHPAQPLRPQGQRQLLHAPGAGRPHRRAHPETAGRGAPPGIRGEGRRSSRATAGPRTSGNPSFSSSTRPRRS